jgi:hypothetical protein
MRYRWSPKPPGSFISSIFLNAHLTARSEVAAPEACRLGGHCLKLAIAPTTGGPPASTFRESASCSPRRNLVAPNVCDTVDALQRMWSCVVTMKLHSGHQARGGREQLRRAIRNTARACTYVVDISGARRRLQP